MRELTDHIQAGGPNAGLRVTVLDEPGAGGACHEYGVYNDDGISKLGDKAGALGLVVFQNGPIQENGVNGITNEVLLTIVIDRLRGFQSGEYSCRENAIALTNIEQALMWLQKRTRDRVSRGVEGTSKK